MQPAIPFLELTADDYAELIDGKKFMIVCGRIVYGNLFDSATHTLKFSKWMENMGELGLWNPRYIDCGYPKYTDQNSN